MANPVRIVLFGNSQAEAVQLPALNHIGGNEVVGIAGYDAEKAAATAENWGIGRSTSNWRELLELDPDLVIVTTPVNLHYEMTRAALDAGHEVAVFILFDEQVPVAAMAAAVFDITQHRDTS